MKYGTPNAYTQYALHTHTHINIYKIYIINYYWANIATLLNRIIRSIKISLLGKPPSTDIEIISNMKKPKN